jgi:hypothetical protein
MDGDAWSSHKWDSDKSFANLKRSFFTTTWSASERYCLETHLIT